MEGIKLVNIDLSGVTLSEQNKKVEEELQEFKDAILDDNFEHVIEEFWDVVQSHLGLLEKFGITAEEVMKGYPKHLEKMKVRPRKKECIKCGYKKNCCLYQSLEWTGEQEAETCESYYDEVR